MPGVHGGSPPRLLFLDGMRGVAALYVVLHHAALMVPPQRLSGPALLARFWLRHGHSAVALFIVLSGFCLMRPVVVEPQGRMPYGLLTYFRRRILRIVPPYYAAVALCWSLIAWVPALGRPARSMWDRSLPGSGLGVVGSHLLLIHNVNPRWLYKLQPPFWSVATEWQIYLVFPALLVLWRRAGIGAVVGVGFAIGFAVAALSVPLQNPALRELCPWYLGLFTLGMAAALVSHRTEATTAAKLSPTGRRLASALWALAAILMAVLALVWNDDRDQLLTDPIVGVVASGLIVRWTRLTRARGPASRPALLKALETRWAIGLGAISYSLYLTHFPVLALADASFRAGGVSADLRLAALTLGISPLCLGAAYAFYLAFERPALRARATRPQSRGLAAPQLTRPGQDRPEFNQVLG